MRNITSLQGKAVLMWLVPAFLLFTCHLCLRPADSETLASGSGRMHFRTFQEDLTRSVLMLPGLRLLGGSGRFSSGGWPLTAMLTLV